jgi:hypothetical protein
MRRRISVLTAGPLAAGTVLATAGAASVGGTAGHKARCTTESVVLTVTAQSVQYFLGVPDDLLPGTTARLKPKRNGSTTLIACAFPASNVTLLENRGLALTSRDFSPGGSVTMTPAGNGGNGFASQMWDFVNVGTSSATFQNAKTGLFLRVPNNGPIMGQNVTTGRTATVWTFSRHQI